MANDAEGPRHVYRRRENDKGWKWLVSGLPLAITLTSIVIGGVVSVTTLYGTVESQGKGIAAADAGHMDREKRIQALEKHQAVTSQRLNSIHEEQLRQRRERKEDTQRILDALTRERNITPRQ